MQIRSVGARSTIPIPAEADKIDGSGKSIVPAPVDACDRADPAGMVRAATAEDACRQVGELIAKRVPVIHLAQSAPVVAEAALEAARGAATPVLAHIATAEEARRLVDHGAAGFIGMIADTEDLDPDFVARLRNLQVGFAPGLNRAGATVEVAKRNTRRLFQAGVPIAAASLGGDLTREIELLVDAGLPPLDAIVAATRNGAVMTRQPDRGTIAEGKRADLLVLSANPGEDIRNLRKVALRLLGGEWMK